MRAVVVVAVDEAVQQFLELGDAGGWGADGEPFLAVCWKRSTLPQVLGWLDRCPTRWPS